MSDVPSMEFTIDELTVLVFQHTRSRMAKRKAARELLISAREDERMKTVYLEIARRLKREEEAKEGKMKLKGLLFSVLIVFLLSFLLMGSVATAQEPTVTAASVIVEATVNGEPVDAVLVDPAATDEATAVVDAEPTQEVISVPEQEGGTLVVGWTAISQFIGLVVAAMAAGFGLSLAAILYIVRGVRSNDLIKDALQKIYMSQPIDVRQKQREIVELAKEGVGLLDDLTSEQAAALAADLQKRSASGGV